MALAGFLILAIGVLVVGIVLIARSRRVGSPYPSCGNCGYDMTGSIGSAVRCPECGAGLARVGITPAGHVRSSSLMLATGIGMTVLATGCLGCSGVSLVGALIAAQERNAAVRATQQAQQAQQQQQAPAPQAAPETAEADEDLRGDRTKEE